MVSGDPNAGKHQQLMAPVGCEWYGLHVITKQTSYVEANIKQAMVEKLSFATQAMLLRVKVKAKMTCFIFLQNIVQSSELF